MSVTDEIKARIDAVDFISRYLPLQRAGRSFKACCPFHQERTPSFVVFPDSGTWRCFGACSTGGDIFSFLMQKENMDFREALQVLAQETGVQLPEETDKGDTRERDLLYELNDRAALFFRNQLHRSQEGQAARRLSATDEASMPRSPHSSNSVSRRTVGMPCATIWWRLGIRPMRCTEPTWSSTTWNTTPSTILFAIA